MKLPQIVEQRTDEYRADLFKRMGFLAHDLITGQIPARRDETRLLELWYRVYGLNIETPAEELAKLLPSEFVAEDIDEQDVPGLTKVLDEYLTELSDKLVFNGAKEYLTPYEIPIEKYDAVVQIFGITAQVEFIHRTTGAYFNLHDIFFDDSGKILQAVLSI